MSFFDEDIPDDSSIAPEDVASAARSCQAVVIMLILLGLLLCAALAVYVLT